MKITQVLENTSQKGLVRASGQVAVGDKERVILAIDHSGSMDIAFMGHKKTRIEAAKDSVRTIVQASHRGTTALGLAAFNHEINVLEKPSGNFTSVVAKSQLLEAEGGTRFGPIFSMAFELEPNRVIILSDGEPDDKTDALRYAESAGVLGIRFDCVGIGESNPEFMKELARLTKGVYAYCDNLASLTKTFASLETRARFQLEHKPGVIKL